jgi:CheY-like chemotaxis protein
MMKSAGSANRDALRALQCQNFELLLTDLMMPEMDGIGLMRAALDIDPHLACILMTGQGTVQTAVEAMKIGALDYVLKPFKMQTLLPVLARATGAQAQNGKRAVAGDAGRFRAGPDHSLLLDLRDPRAQSRRAALKQLDADEVSLLLPTDDGNELYVAAVLGDKREKMLGKRIPFDKGIAGWVARHLVPLRLEGEVMDERFQPVCPRPDIVSSVSIMAQIDQVLNVNATRRRSFTMGR